MNSPKLDEPATQHDKFYDPLLPPRLSMALEIEQLTTQELFDQLAAQNIDMIALVKPEADFIREIEQYLLWLDGRAERTDELHLIPAKSSALKNEEIFPRDECTSWQVYVWEEKKDYMFIQCLYRSSWDE
jgi:hypothetical protein